MTGFVDDGHVSLLVRPYALTGGRTRPDVDIAIEALIIATPHAVQGLRGYGRSSVDQHVLELCHRRPISLAEIAALTHVPLGVARILVADLLAEGLVAIASRTVTSDHSTDVLSRVLSGLRRL